MRDSKGFTLIEIILVIVIMAIAIPAIIGGISFMTQSQINPLATTTAANLARERMEQVVADKRNPAIPFTAIDEVVDGGRYADETPVPGFANYDRLINIVCVAPANLDVNAGCPTNYRRVQVTVQANGVGPSVPDVLLVTLLTDF